MESVSVEGIDIEDDYVTLFLEDDRDLKVPADLLQIAMNGQRVCIFFCCKNDSQIECRVAES